MFYVHPQIERLADLTNPSSELVDQLYAQQQTWGGKEGLSHLHRREMNQVGVRCTRPPWSRVKGAAKQRRAGIQRGQRGQAMADGPSTRWRQRGNQRLTMQEPNGGGAGTSGQWAGSAAVVYWTRAWAGSLGVD